MEDWHRKIHILVYLSIAGFVLFFGFGAEGREVLRPGMEGARVTSIQKQLNDLGFELTVDGVFGQETEEIVEAFQKSFGLEVDGLVGPETKSLLEELVQTTSYTVRRGDTLSGIASKYGVNIDAIRLANDLRGDMIRVGDELVIPRSGVGGGGSGEVMAYTEYTVRRGDTLSEIAYRFNTQTQAIKNYNNLSSERIIAGKTLTIPHLVSSSSADGIFTLREDSLMWPVKGQITSGYGWRKHPIYKNREFHSGIDVAAPTGTPVRAAARGVVSKAENSGGYGKTVIIDHGGGVSTLYAHNSRLLVREGAEVITGQVIAKVGSTGTATGPHVHFEVYVNNENVNPMKYLQ